MSTVYDVIYGHTDDDGDRLEVRWVDEDDHVQISAESAWDPDAFVSVLVPIGDLIAALTEYRDREGRS